MNWLSLLNPLNWIKILGLVKGLFDLAIGIYKSVNDWLKLRAIAKKNEEVVKAAEALKEANGVKDDTERLAAKAEAACKLEKLANPDSDCGQ